MTTIEVKQLFDEVVHILEERRLDAATQLRFVHLFHELREVTYRLKGPQPLPPFGTDFLPANPGLTPDLRAWALQQGNEEEMLARLKEVQEKGGQELSVVIEKLKHRQAARESTNS
jgi:hypothetical protein